MSKESLQIFVKNILNSHKQMDLAILKS